MIDFKEELQKFKPILETDSAGETFHDEDAQDIIELLRDIKEKLSNSKE